MSSVRILGEAIPMVIRRFGLRMQMSTFKVRSFSERGYCFLQLQTYYFCYLFKCLVSLKKCVNSKLLQPVRVSWSVGSILSLEMGLYVYI